MRLKEAIERASHRPSIQKPFEVSDYFAAVELLIEAGKCVEDAKDTGYFGKDFLLPSETE